MDPLLPAVVGVCPSTALNMLHILPAVLGVTVGRRLVQDPKCWRRAAVWLE